VFSQENAAAASKGAPNRPSVRECVASHRQAQLLRRDQKLLEAKDQVLRCLHDSCPSAVIGECGRLLEALEQEIPSVTFAVTRDGAPELRARVSADGAPVPNWTKGSPLPVNPGEHTFRFELEGHPTLVKAALFPVGSGIRMIEIAFTPTSASTAPASPAPPGAPERIRRRLPGHFYPIATLGVLGAAGFATFGLRGMQREKELEDRCSPHCTAEDTEPLERTYWIANLSGGVGAAALLTAGIIYVTRPPSAKRESSRRVLDVVPTRGGGFATMTWDLE
jgi:hypothetical protein